MTILIIIAGIILDRITKIWAVNTLSGGYEIIIIQNYLSFLYTENKGAAFSIFENKTELLTITSIVVMCIIVFFAFKYRSGNIFIRISLALIISGALGNLVDRVKYKHVIDFISVHYRNIYYFPIFNLADVMVVIGTLILVLYLLRDEKYEN